MTEILAIVGTMSGNAEIVAEEAGEAVEDMAQIDVQLMNETTADEVKDAKLLLVVCSTYGTGDIPDNATDLFESLEKDTPDLSNLRYGVIAMGDSSFGETFCNGGKQWDGLLSKLGAVRIGDVLKLDASDSLQDPEEEAIAWTKAWLEKLQLKAVA